MEYCLHMNIQIITAGIDDLRPYTYKMGEVPIYAQERVIESLKIRFSYIFETENRYAGAPKLTENIIDSNSFMLNGVRVTPIAVMHGKLPITGYRFGNVAYITDLKNHVRSRKKEVGGFRHFNSKCIKNNNSSYTFKFRRSHRFC